MDIVSVKVGAGDVRLAATYGAASQIEAALSAPIESIYSAHRMGGLTLVELAQIIEIGMKSASEDGNAETIVKHLFSQYAKTDQDFRTKIADYLLALVWSPEDRKKKLQSEWLDFHQEESQMPLETALGHS